MSSTLRFTPFHPIDYEYVEARRNSHGVGVKILDRDGLENALSETMVSQMDTRSYTDRGEYPRKEWDVLLGFTTWGRDEDEPGGGADYHNVSNTDVKDFSETFATVSEYTEPFVVWCTTFEGHWPHAAELAGGDNGAIYEVTATDGDVSLTEIQVGVTDRESVSE